MARWRNNPESYGRLARGLHWGVALLFIAAYCAVYYRHWFTVKDTPENWIALQLHLSIGVTIAVFVILRVIWVMQESHPLPPPGKPWEHVAARAMHILLYVIMIYMPLTGYLGTKADTEFFFLFDIPKFPDTALFQWLVTDKFGLSFEEWEAPLDFIHKKSGAYLVWVLVLLHAGAAIYHHVVRRDNTLRRMWSGQ